MVVEVALPEVVVVGLVLVQVGGSVVVEATWALHENLLCLNANCWDALCRLPIGAVHAKESGTQHVHRVTGTVQGP